MPYQEVFGAAFPVLYVRSLRHFYLTRLMYALNDSVCNYENTYIHPYIYIHWPRCHEENSMSFNIIGSWDE